MTNFKPGDVVRWGSGKQKHYGVVVETEGTRVRVEYTHSTPASNAPSGRILDLHTDTHTELRVI